MRVQLHYPGYDGATNTCDAILENLCTGRVAGRTRLKTKGMSDGTPRASRFGRSEIHFVAARNAGNDQSKNRRLGLAVMGALKTKQAYRINPTLYLRPGFQSAHVWQVCSPGSHISRFSRNSRKRLMRSVTRFF